MKKFRSILIISITLIVVLSGVFIYKMNINDSENRERGTNNLPGCGNTDLTESQSKGKEIFNSNCAACHKLNSKSTGPALQEVDSIVFVNWLTNKKYKIDSTKIEILAIDYHKTVFSKTLSKEDVAFLIEYCHSK